MNPRQAKEYKASQKRKVEQAKEKVEQAKEAKREKMWSEFKGVVMALAIERGEEMEMARAREELGDDVDKWGGDFRRKVTEIHQANGDIKIVVFTKYMPLLVKNPRFTVTETIIGRASLLSKLDE
jgi:hypothetical protein